VALLGLALTSSARAADPARAIPANVNDPGIDAARGANLVWLAPADRRVGKLLVFLPLGGMNNRPTEFEEIGSEAGRLGYHTIVLAYKNEVPIANAAACGNEVDPLPPPAPANCAINARTEMLDGSTVSPVINVDRANSIENRLIKALQHLVATFPAEGWSRFLDTSGAQPAPKWSETVIAGGSLGAGQVALIAEKHLVHRASMFSGWTDAKHGWVTLGATPADRYFTLIHAGDNFYERTCAAYAVFGMAQACPLTDPADPLLVENRQPPFTTPQLVFNIQPDPTAPVIADPFHPSTVRDGYIPKATPGGTAPSQQLVNAWRATLGDSDADGWLEQDQDNSLEHADNCPQIPNPDQTDTDTDTIGDACDATPRGTVPPTITVTGLTADATGPNGALVNYIATATDDLDPDPTPVCTPAAGSLFAIGSSALACSATDASGNTANASFTVTVLGAKQQIAALIAKVINSTTLPTAVKTQLTASLQSLVAGFDPSKPLQRAIACLSLRAFTTLVPYVAPPAPAAEWTTDANRIRAVLAC
jgi:hypothetical protein